MFKVEEEGAESVTLLDFISTFIDGFTFGTISFLQNILTNGDQKSEVKKHINKISSDFNPTPYLEAALSERDEVVEKVRNAFLSELIEPLQEQIASVLEFKKDKEVRVTEAQQSLAQLIEKKKEVENQKKVIDELKSTIS